MTVMGAFRQLSFPFKNLQGIELRDSLLGLFNLSIRLKMNF